MEDLEVGERMVTSWMCAVVDTSACKQPVNLRLTLCSYTYHIYIHKHEGMTAIITYKGSLLLPVRLST